MLIRRKQRKATAVALVRATNDAALAAQLHALAAARYAREAEAALERAEAIGAALAKRGGRAPAGNPPDLWPYVLWVHDGRVELWGPPPKPVPTRPNHPKTAERGGPHGR
jgi:hypothetical protein